MLVKCRFDVKIDLQMTVTIFIYLRVGRLMLLEYVPLRNCLYLPKLILIFTLLKIVAKIVLRGVEDKVSRKMSNYFFNQYWPGQIR